MGIHEHIETMNEEERIGYRKAINDIEEIIDERLKVMEEPLILSPAKNHLYKIKEKITKLRKCNFKEYCEDTDEELIYLNEEDEE